jgi:PPK2 family polyphosphate:nucleotide phosphotransferase
MPGSGARQVPWKPNGGPVIAVSRGVSQRHIDIRRFKVAPDAHLSLSKYPPGDTAPWTERPDAKQLLHRAARRLYTLTELLFAQNRWSVLFILQAMDGAGKDSAVKHVMRGLDPKSTQVFSFKAPSSEELKHDFMWRCLKNLPERGRIGVFNRSYYEDVLITRVHPELLADRRLPKSLVTPRIWKERFHDICAIERYLARNGTVICKIFLNVSKAEQRRRFLARLDDPAKRWKLSLNDITERRRWNEYVAAYQDAIAETSTSEAPWYIVPADNKWYAHLAIAQIAIKTLEGLKLAIPEHGHRDKKMWRAARKILRG